MYSVANFTTSIYNLQSTAYLECQNSRFKIKQIKLTKEWSVFVQIAV